MNRWLEADTTHLLPESKEDFEALLRAIDNPPEPNEKLKQLMSTIGDKPGVDHSDHRNR